MDDSECVRVAVNVRPLITPELLMGCTDCITVVPGEPQVQIGSHCFTYDYVFGSTGLHSSKIYERCIGPLVDALFEGYNATVLAYGQTGSGKTYTMGTNYTGESGSDDGIIPNVVETIFKRVEEAITNTEFLIRVSFIEIFKEEVYDLLDPNSSVKAEAMGPKVTAPSRVPIQIRETVNGGITLAGVTEPEVRSKEEMSSYLLRGSLARATGSTNMNAQSSRSHAIFTISLEQKKILKSGPGGALDNASDDRLAAKLHLVDLAGSERAKRTGADGLRLKEGIHINKGLLALGNVISALGDEKKRKEGGHVPYRDSKLTRLLQDSLGGNSKTVMIACVSPAETNAEETLNTLKYANRARNIQNKAIVNRDPISAQIQRMRSQIEQLQAELSFYRGDSTSPLDEIQILKHRVLTLESSNTELHRELEVHRENCNILTQRAFDVQIERDKLHLQIESARNGASWEEIEGSRQDVDLLQTYVHKIQELEGDLLRLRSRSKRKQSDHDYTIDSDDDRFCSRSELFPTFNDLPAHSSDTKDEIEDEEREHSSRQEKLDREMMELDKKLEQKEDEMKRLPNGDNAKLKLHYEKKVKELEHEKKALQKEIDDLRSNLENISSISDGSTQKLKEEYLQKLTTLEAQVVELKKKQDAQTQLLRQKQKSEDAARKLQDEIQRIKTQKVQLQQKIKQESEQFRQWKASREKEVLQLRKEGRRNEYEMHKLMALNQRQKMALQRKTEEAALAAKRLKELLEGRKTSSGNISGPTTQALMQSIEHELEVTVRVHEVRSAYERQLEERGRLAKELARLKEETIAVRQSNISDSPSSLSPGARNSRMFALENMLSASSGTLVSMASQLSEAEERERGFSGRGRWNNVRTLADAKNVMNHLFNIASTSRCLLRDREIGLREKEDEMKDLKDKVVKLNAFARHLQFQKNELIRQLKSQSQNLLKNNQEATCNDGFFNSGVVKTEVSDLRRTKVRDVSQRQVRDSVMLLEDMDTAESENSDSSDEDYSLPTEKETSDDESARPNKQGQMMKKNFKSIGHASAETDPSSENQKFEFPTNPFTEKTNNVGSSSCCTCSKSSLCKTGKCQCRAAHGICGPSCGCLPSKCSNRESGDLQLSESGLPNEDDNADNGYHSDDEESRALASHGAMLLRSALASRPDGSQNDGEAKRKPLSDIGNTQAKSNNARPNQRKKWRKAVIQLVPVTTPSTQPTNSEEAVEKQDKSNTNEAEVPLKLPRAMQPAESHSNNALLRERNSDQLEDPSNKDTTIPPHRRSSRTQKPADEKENYTR